MMDDDVMIDFHCWKMELYMLKPHWREARLNKNVAINVVRRNMK